MHRNLVSYKYVCERIVIKINIKRYLNEEI